MPRQPNVNYRHRVAFPDDTFRRGYSRNDLIALKHYPLLGIRVTAGALSKAAKEQHTSTNTLVPCALYEAPLADESQPALPKEGEMTKSEQIEYYSRRELQQWQLAARSTDTEIIGLHEMLAGHYAGLIQRLRMDELRPPSIERFLGFMGV